MRRGGLANYKATELPNYKFLMIFGFNTDVKHGDTIYHVQSEARESEKLLQTQVFVRGSCVGKKAISYANSALEAGFSDAQKEQQLRDQHRLVLEAIREGKLDSVLDRAETETLAAIKQLDVEWINAASVHTNRNLTMRLRVTEDGTAVPSARLTFRFARPDVRPFLYPGRHRLRRQHRNLSRGRGICLARFLHHGPSQPRRPHRNPQVRSCARASRKVGLQFSP
jgi:hypothetical protein